MSELRCVSWAEASYSSKTAMEYMRLMLWAHLTHFCFESDLGRRNFFGSSLFSSFKQSWSFFQEMVSKPNCLQYKFFKSVFIQIYFNFGVCKQNFGSKRRKNSADTHLEKVAKYLTALVKFQRFLSCMYVCFHGLEEMAVWCYKCKAITVFLWRELCLSFDFLKE